LVLLIIQNWSGRCIRQSTVYLLVCDFDIPLYAQKRPLHMTWKRTHTWRLDRVDNGGAAVFSRFVVPWICRLYQTHSTCVDDVCVCVCRGGFVLVYKRCVRVGFPPRGVMQCRSVRVYWHTVPSESKVWCPSMVSWFPKKSPGYGMFQVYVNLWNVPSTTHLFQSTYTNVSLKYIMTRRPMSIKSVRVAWCWIAYVGYKWRFWAPSMRV